MIKKPVIDQPQILAEIHRYWNKGFTPEKTNRLLHENYKITLTYHQVLREYVKLSHRPHDPPEQETTPPCPP